MTAAPQAPVTGPPIRCPRTGRTWPRAAAIDLRTCTACGGLIDTRRVSWCDGPTHGVCPPAGGNGDSQ